MGGTHGLLVLAWLCEVFIKHDNKSLNNGNFKKISTLNYLCGVKNMSLSKNQKITIFLGIVVALTTIWSITYTNSADLLYTDFNPPETISNSGNTLRFELTNYGEKTGAYFLSISASSNDIQFSKNRDSSDDYENDISLNYKLGPDRDVIYDFKLKANNSAKNSNVTVILIYIDKSPWILKKATIYKYNYKLKENNYYKLQDEKLTTKNTYIINGGAYTFGK